MSWREAGPTGSDVAHDDVPTGGDGAVLRSPAAAGTATAVPGRPRARALGRVAAVTALASAGVHLALLHATSLGSVVMLLMAVGCLPCAGQLWRSPTAPVWRFTALVDAGMLVLHLQMLGRPATAVPGMDPGMHDRPSVAMALGLALVGAQLVLAGGAAVDRALAGRASRPSCPWT